MLPILYGVGVLVTAVGLAALAAGVWLVIAGDREGDMLDEPPTLDVQNHLGDRP